MVQQISEIIIDDTSYSLSKFSEQVQDLVALRHRWQVELEKEREAALKTEAAIRQIDMELAAIVKQELGS
jgi:hypothetical protein